MPHRYFSVLNAYKSIMLYDMLQNKTICLHVTIVKRRFCDVLISRIHKCIVNIVYRPAFVCVL